jgi:VIT1/CCC1 family predicted Fe2+/Mn2+ transporter
MFGRTRGHTGPGALGAVFSSSRLVSVSGDVRPDAVPSESHYDDEHVGASRQYWRDIILGVNDGLVSIFLLVAGVVGGGLSADQVLLTALAGAIAGAISMAAGEYLATQSQEEVFDREIALEKQHIREYREGEVDQLRDFFRDMGVSEDDLPTVVDAFARDDTTLLNAMKSLEFGIVDSERRSPYTAMAMSGGLFLIGASPSVAPFLLVDSAAYGLVIASVLTAFGLFAVGALKTRVTDTHPIKSGLENLIIAGVGGVIAYLVGSLVEGTIT